ncbi:MAG TPA: hypothetical protein VFG65_08980, partial [Fimbriimonadales bacterium]|nr:hypothetical protein [Fimbriimonadales bacterium]
MKRLKVSAFMSALLVFPTAVYSQWPGQIGYDGVFTRLQARLKAEYAYIESPEEGRNLIAVEGPWQYSYGAGFRYVPPTDVPAPEYYGGIASIIGDRLVRSKPGYRKVEGHVFPGVVTGVDRYPGEAAYNYFGIKREDEFDFEGGLVRDAHSSNWFVYHALNGTVFPDNWPQGGIPPGSDVFMRTYVPTPNRVFFYVSYSAPGGFGIETAAWDIAYDAPGLDPNGTNQRIRRNSSLIVDLTGSSGPNIWQGVLA